MPQIGFETVPTSIAGDGGKSFDGPRHAPVSRRGSLDPAYRGSLAGPAARLRRLGEFS